MEILNSLAIILTILSFPFSILGLLYTIQPKLAFDTRRKIDGFFTNIFSKKNQFTPLEYDCEDDEIFTLNRWSKNRILKEENLDTYVSKRPRFDKFISKEDFVSFKDSGKYEGNICYLVGIEIDHYEHIRGRRFIMKIAPCDYSEHMATRQIMRNKPELREAIKKNLISSPQNYLKNALPSNVAINVIVVSDRGNLLVIKRSGGVTTAGRRLTLGIYETMTLFDPEKEQPGIEENLFELARRGLNEELGLRKSQYGNILISYLGIALRSLRSQVVAIVKLKISEEELLETAHKAHSIYESQKFEWRKFDKNLIQSFIQYHSRNRQRLDGVYQNIIYESEEWLIDTPLALQEYWRMKDVYELYEG